MCNFAADVMYVNDVTFITSVSNHMQYETSNAVEKMKVQVLGAGLTKITKSYEIRGFSVGVFF